VYAVRTTGVFCRPDCPSRLPLRRNVVFFDTIADARHAGFRACKRCKPGAAPAASAVERARAYLEDHLDRPVSLGLLARAVGQSPSHLQRTFTRAFGVSPKRYAAALRAERTKTELRRGATVSRATFQAGYSASSRLYEAAPAHFGMAPGAYRNGGRGEVLRFVITGSPLGQVLVAATARGIAAVTLGSSDRRLVAELATEYPKAQRDRVRLESLGADDPLRVWTESVVHYLKGAGSAHDLPLDVPATPFQWRVWTALRSIPAGERRTYSEVAAAIGAPTAARGVARACATNPAALVIPCHRVLRGDGSLGGYRWGLERKRRLLAGEHAVIARRLDP
jgi:AraC family transcriptional regulator of adaptative response/methylated-DNA-[protein]-cysteine methyltransferase